MGTRQQVDAGVESIRVGPEHPRYAAVLNKRFNKRFIGRPDYVRLAASTEHVVTAVQQAVNEQQRVVVTSGGHCWRGSFPIPMSA